MLDMVECSLACTLKHQLVEPQLYFAQWTSQLALDAFALSVWQTLFLLFFAKSHDFQEGHCLEVPSGQPYPLHHCVIQRCCLTVSNSSILNNLLFLSHCSISFFIKKYAQVVTSIVLSINTSAIQWYVFLFFFFSWALGLTSIWLVVCFSFLFLEQYS